MRGLFLVAVVLMQLPPGMPPATQTFKVSGRVLTSSGEPLRGKGLFILIGHEQGNGFESSGYPIDEDGTFHSDLAPGRYLLTVGSKQTPRGESVPLEERGFTAVTVSRADITSVVIQMRPRIHVRGRVRYEAATASTTYPSVNIFSVPAFDGLGVGVGEENAKWDADGTFDLVVGAVPVVIRNGYSGSGDMWWPGPVLLDGQDITDVPTDFSKAHGELEVVFTQRPIGVYGIVTEDSTQLPAENASVMVFPAEPMMRQPWANASKLLAADDQGRFWSTLSAGKYFAVAFPNGTFTGVAEALRALPLFEKLATPFTIDPERRGARVHLTLSRPPIIKR